MADIPSRENLVEQIKDLQRRLDDLESAARLPSASYEEPGRIAYYDEEGNLRAYLGAFDFGAGLTIGLILYDAEGVAHFISGDGGSGYGITVRDEHQNTIVATDVLNFGLARPYVSGQWYPLDFVNLRTSGSGSWNSLFAAKMQVQHPKIEVRVGITADSGTEGQWRVYDSTDSKVIIPAGSIPDGISATTIGTGTFDEDDFGEEHMLELQVQVTSGSGDVGVEPHSLWGRQT